MPKRKSRHWRPWDPDAPAIGVGPRSESPTGRFGGKSVFDMTNAEMMDYLVERGAEGRRNALVLPEDPKDLLRQGWHEQAAVEWPQYRAMMESQQPFQTPPSKLTPGDITYLEEHLNQDLDRPSGPRGKFYRRAPVARMQAEPTQGRMRKKKKGPPPRMKAARPPKR